MENQKVLLKVKSNLRHRLAFKNLIERFFFRIMTLYWCGCTVFYYVLFLFVMGEYGDEMATLLVLEPCSVRSLPGRLWKRMKHVVYFRKGNVQEHRKTTIT